MTTEVAQQLVNGIALGSVYALLALGLAIVFSIMHLINFAHGELITVSAYTMLGLASMGLPWPVFAPAGVLAAIAAALVTERVAFRSIRGRSAIAAMVSSLGLAILIQGLFAAFVSPRPRAVPQPSWIDETLELLGVRLQVHALLTLAVTAVALLLLQLVLRNTTWGLRMRAAADDFDAARLIGIRSRRVIASAFAIAGALAGIASVLYLARRGLASPTMGLSLLLGAFVANVVGGLGSIIGPVFAGFALGVLEVAIRAWFPQVLAPFANAFIYAIVGLVLLVRPSGVFVRRSSRADEPAH